MDKEKKIIEFNDLISEIKNMQETKNLKDIKSILEKRMILNNQLKNYLNEFKKNVFTLNKEERYYQINKLINELEEYKKENDDVDLNLIFKELHTYLKENERERNFEAYDGKVKFYEEIEITAGKFLIFLILFMLFVGSSLFVEFNAWIFAIVLSSMFLYLLTYVVKKKVKEKKEFYLRKIK